MKKSFYILIFAILSSLLCSCEKEPLTNGGESYYPIFNGYMQFSTFVPTRAEKVLDMKGRTFGVIGYQYSGTTDWNAAKALATPMKDFYNQEVECHDDGVCTYDIDKGTAENQLKQWESGSRYAFFAYHPYEGSGISLSGKDAVGTPYLTYKYNWRDEANAGDRIDVHKRNDVFDLMTGEDINCDGSKKVALAFRHRLFGLEVLANNYNENVYVYEYETDADGNQILDDKGNPKVKVDADGDPIPAKDDNGNPIYAEWEEDVLDANGNPTGEKRKVSGDKRQRITDLVVKVGGLKYYEMSIPLLDSEVEDNIEYTTGQVGTYNDNDNVYEVRFGISTREVVVPAFNQVERDGSKSGRGIPTSISKKGTPNSNGYVMLIPQKHEGTQKMKFTVSWTEASNFASVHNSLDSSLEFEAGRLYQIIINFVGSGVTIALIEAGSWDTKDVPYTFE